MSSFGMSHRDWAGLQDETVRLLCALLQADTSNPPGNETACAHILQEYLGRNAVAGIGHRHHHVIAGRDIGVQAGVILVEHDRITPNSELSDGKSDGLIILKSCIIEIRKLPLQESLKWHLNSKETTDKAEYALQPKKRKTPKINRTGATK